MEDLDALLDELHSTTNNISSYQQHQQRLASQSGSLTGDYSTIPDSPSHTNGNDSLDSQQPIYEVQTIKTQQTTTQNQSNYDSQAQPQGHYPHPQPPPPQAVQAPPPASPQKMTTLSNNLSELDMLLQDLNSAQFLAEVDRRNTANVQQSPPPVQDGRPSVDNLLDDLQRSVPASPYSTVNQAKAMNQSPMHQTKTVRTVTTTTVHNDNQQQGLPPQQQGMSLQQQGMVSQQQGMSQQQQGMSQQQQGMSQGYAAVGQVSPPVQGSYAAVGQVSPPMQGTSGPAASTATRELDDLMNSLSEFKINANKGPAPQHVGEPAYALPNKARVTSQDATGSSMSATTSSSQHTNAVQGGGAGEGGAAMMHSQVQHVHQGAVTSQGPRGSQQLDTMLGNLQSDMNKHGVATIPKGHCAACSKPIVGQVITALGRIWHPEHFTCVQCHEELGTQNFFERDSLPYCEKDYHQLFSPRCAYCGGPILDKCVTALDKTWHPEHFFCAQCGRPFNDEGFHEKEGKAFCREDYFEMFAPKCGGCNRPIMDNYISALNRQWHPECFVCQECRIPFGGGSFFDHDGLPYCETHYHARRGSLCATCNKPITGRCITAMYRKFHPEHFVCAFCLKQLNKGTFKEQNDKPYCHPCFVKLFS